jgi:hypothetical protein
MGKVSPKVLSHMKIVENGDSGKPYFRPLFRDQPALS